MTHKEDVQTRARFLRQSIFLSVALLNTAHGAWGTVKSDLGGLTGASGTIQKARDDLATSGTIQAATVTVQTLLGTPAHNPAEAGSIKGIVTDLKDDIESGAASITAALGSVGAVLDVDPTTGVVDDLKTQVDAIAALTDNSSGLRTMIDTAGVSTMTTELGYTGTIGAQITAALAALDALSGQTSSSVTLTGAHASLSDAIADLESKIS